MVFARYIWQNAIEKEILFCHLLQTKTADTDVLQVVTEYFEKRRVRLAKASWRLHRWSSSDARLPIYTFV